MTCPGPTKFPGAGSHGGFKDGHYTDQCHYLGKNKYCECGNLDTTPTNALAMIAAR